MRPPRRGWHRAGLVALAFLVGLGAGIGVTGAVLYGVPKLTVHRAAAPAPTPMHASVLTSYLAAPDASNPTLSVPVAVAWARKPSAVRPAHLAPQMAATVFVRPDPLPKRATPAAIASAARLSPPAQTSATRPSEPAVSTAVVESPAPGSLTGPDRADPQPAIVRDPGAPPATSQSPGKLAAWAAPHIWTAPPPSSGPALPPLPAGLAAPRPDPGLAPVVAPRAMTPAILTNAFRGPEPGRVGRTPNSVLQVAETVLLAWLPQQTPATALPPTPATPEPVPAVWLATPDRTKPPPTPPATPVDLAPLRPVTEPAGVATLAPWGPLEPRPLVAAAPDPLRPTWPGAPVRVFIPGSVSQADRDDLIARLGAGEVPTAAPETVGFRVSRTNVRYYHPNDAEIARHAAALIGGTARSFVGARNAPPEGQLYLYVSGRPVRLARPAP